MSLTSKPVTVVSGPPRELYLPEAPVQRVIVHWTGGGHKASIFDRAHYHFLIEGDGRIVRGLLPPGRWPAHCRGLNRHSLAVSLCGMGGSREYPFEWGKMPITEAQSRVVTDVLAWIVKRYRLAISERTVLSHAEVTEVYGIVQRGKWDVRVWPGTVLHGERYVGGLIRAAVKKKLSILGTSR